MKKNNGVNIHIQGIVQGVGFRPFVFGLAQKYNLIGWVRNTSAGVNIKAEGPQLSLENFIQALQTEAPPLSQIDLFEYSWQASKGFDRFEIHHSTADSTSFQPISPDISICLDCLAELFTQNDKRFRYPFINCTNCGPRFTIIKDIPYDRPMTTMSPFPMCAYCKTQYIDPSNRRFHAQPVACPECGPHIWLELPGNKQHKEKEDALQTARHMLAKGRILAIKGLGGFHLACDATNPAAVVELRRRKLRVDKPFAVMFYDIEMAKQHSQLNAADVALLESRERPIVIIERQTDSAIVDDVSPNQTTIGVMLPYTPLHYLLLEPEEGYPTALVMTSGNLSEEPIVTSNPAAHQQLNTIADAFLLHNRAIHIRCDDSVYRTITPPEKPPQPYPLRRSRGYAPQPIRLPWAMPPILATGAEMKNTFCLTAKKYAFLSHHIGDMENYETYQSFESGITHYQNLFRIQPELIAHDLHPDYMATRYAIERAAAKNIPTIPVQHHHAHIVACMAEHKLPDNQPVIGVAFDGTGLGTDNTIWGGEFLLTSYTQFERPYHLSPIPLPGGDKAIKETWRMGLSLLQHAGLNWQEILPAIDPQAAQVVLHQINKQINAPLTSSMGRLFDGIAALAGIRQTANYEAQAAIELEALTDPNETNYYSFAFTKNQIDPTPAIRNLINDLQNNIPRSTISARFHNSVAQMTCHICVKLRAIHNINTVALSGGVWQNTTLLHKTLSLLHAQNFTPLIHQQVPANDGGLALGQAIIAFKSL